MGQLSDLEKILCEERDAVSLMTIVERLRSLCQWVRVDEVGSFTIFDRKPEDGPTYAWKDTMAYIPFSERLCSEFEEKCAKAGPLLLTASQLIGVTARLVLALEREHKIHRVRLLMYMESLTEKELSLERKKSEDLMKEMSDYFRKDKYPHPDLCPMFSTFKRYNQ